MFVLSKRFAVLGGDYSGKKKTEKGQAQALNLLTFELEEIPLDPAEVNALFGSQFAYGRLHCYSLTEKDRDDQPKLEPFLPGLKSLEFANALEGACITLHYGLQRRELRFTDCKLSKMTISLGEDGETMLSFKVTAAPALDETLAELFDQFGKPIECEVRSYPPDAQEELPLASNRFGEGEQPEAPKKRGRPRKSGNVHTH